MNKIKLTSKKIFWIVVCIIIMVHSIYITSVFIEKPYGEEGTGWIYLITSPHTAFFGATIGTFLHDKFGFLFEKTLNSFLFIILSDILWLFRL